MNARTDTHAARSFEAVSYSDWSYTMTEDSFPEGAIFVTDVTGTVRATGRCLRGDVVTVMLDTPLCQGCDGVIENHLCLDCELAFGGEV